MSHYPTTIRDLTGNPAIEAMELRACGSGSAGFADEEPLGSSVTWDDVDAMWVEEMERRDRDAATVFGGGGDDDDTTPGGSALPVPDYAAIVGRLSDGELIEGVPMLTDGTPGTGWCALMGVYTEAQRDEYLALVADEIRRRIDRPSAVRAA